MRTVSTPAAISMTAEYTDEVWLVLLTLDHPALPSPIRVANNNEDVVSNGQTYIGLPFSIELPADKDDEPGVATIQIPNVDRSIVETIRSIDVPPTVVIQVVLASSPNTVEVQFVGLTMRDTEWDAGFVRGRLRFEEVVVEPITYTITPDRFPGLF